MIVLFKKRWKKKSWSEVHSAMGTLWANLRPWLGAIDTARGRGSNSLAFCPSDWVGALQAGGICPFGLSYRQRRNGVFDLTFLIFFKDFL